MHLSSRKLVKYVIEGRLSRLKRFLREEKKLLIADDPDLAADEAWMDEIKVKNRKHCFGDETLLLHLTASIGDERVLRYLLKIGFGRRQGALPQRGDRLTPLHLAVSRCQRTLKTRGGKSAIEDFQDYVKPVLDACPRALEVKNQLGERGSLVLEELQAEIAREEKGLKNDGDEKADDDDDDDDENKNDDRRWREKMRDECEFEMETTSGGGATFQEDWMEDEKRDETFKDFAERIEREYRERFRQQRTTEREKRRKKTREKGEGNRTRSSKFVEEIDLDKHRRYEEMKRVMTLKNKKLDYERRWDEFFKDIAKDKEKRFGFEEIPWPKPLIVKEEESAARKIVAEMLEISTFTINDEDKEKERRLEIKRWHPDKVMQKINVKDSDSQFVAFVVKELAQALNSLKPK